MSLLITDIILPKKENVIIEIVHNGKVCAEIQFDTSKYCIRGFKREIAEGLVSHSRGVRLDSRNLEIGILSLVANEITATPRGVEAAIRHVLDCLVEV